jgi:diacylglycerol kinase family enzyme
VGALAAGLSSQGDKVRVTADGAVLADGRRRVLQVGIGNGPYIGGGTALTPDADPTDGRLDVMVSFAVPRWDRLLYAVRLERGTHDRRQDVVTTRATHVEISGEPFLYNADGEVATPVRRRRWQLQAGAFMMMLPTRAQADGAG